MQAYIGLFASTIILVGGFSMFTYWPINENFELDADAHRLLAVLKLNPRYLPESDYPHHWNIQYTQLSHLTTEEHSRLKLHWEAPLPVQIPCVLGQCKERLWDEPLHTTGEEIPRYVENGIAAGFIRYGHIEYYVKVVIWK